jgi:hypothetical protein
MNVSGLDHALMLVGQDQGQALVKEQGGGLQITTEEVQGLLIASGAMTTVVATHTAIQGSVEHTTDPDSKDTIKVLEVVMDQGEGDSIQEVIDHLSIEVVAGDVHVTSTITDLVVVIVLITTGATVIVEIGHVRGAMMIVIEIAMVQRGKEIGIGNVQEEMMIARVKNLREKEKGKLKWIINMMMKTMHLNLLMII